MHQIISGNYDFTDTTDLSVKSRCLSLECGAYPIFTNNFCGDSLLTICSKSGRNLYTQ